MSTLPLTAARRQSPQQFAEAARKKFAAEFEADLPVQLLIDRQDLEGHDDTPEQMQALIAELQSADMSCSAMNPGVYYVQFRPKTGRRTVTCRFETIRSVADGSQSLLLKIS